MRLTPLLVSGLALGAPALLAAQGADDVATLAERLARLTAVSGYEQPAIDTLLALLPGAARDRAGDAVLRIGAGDRRRLAVCTVDEPGFVVGSVRDDGYLTLRRVGRPSGPLADQQIEGQRITVQGRRGPVAGVVGVRSVHLTRGRATPGDEPFALDDAFVDVGAASRTEVGALGIGVLAPVALAKRPHRYGGDLLAAPTAGNRAACAALVAAARRAGAAPGMVPGDASVVLAFAVEGNFTGRGLATLGAALGPFDETIVVGAEPGVPGELAETVESGGRRPPGLGQVTRWSLRARYAGWPVETVSLKDAQRLSERLAEWIGGAK